MQQRSNPGSGINLDDPVAKVVGNRRVKDPVRYGMELQNSGARMMERIHIPKGVYRFHTFQEADQWMNRMLSRPKV